VKKTLNWKYEIRNESEEQGRESYILLISVNRNNKITIFAFQYIKKKILTFISSLYIIYMYVCIEKKTEG